jgi:hypothetical protein
VTQEDVGTSRSSKLSAVTLDAWLTLRRLSVGFRPDMAQ